MRTSDSRTSLTCCVVSSVAGAVVGLVRPKLALDGPSFSEAFTASPPDILSVSKAQSSADCPRWALTAEVVEEMMCVEEVGRNLGFEAEPKSKIITYARSAGRHVWPKARDGSLGCVWGGTLRRGRKVPAR
jgi:hypothetical protein